MNPYHQDNSITLYNGDALSVLRELPDVSVNCCVTSPPYFGLRSYLDADDSSKHLEIGAEQTPDEFIANLVAVFREVRRVLRDDGTLWVNIGDSYNNTDKWGGGQNIGIQTVSKDGTIPSFQVRNKRPKLNGIKPKDLIGIPWMLAFALRADGWFLRQDIIWHKPNPMPESVTDRCTKAHEYVFLLSKSAKYHFDSGAIAESAQTWTGRAATFDRSGNAVASHIIPNQSAAQHRPRVNEETRKAIRTNTESRHRSAVVGGQSLLAEPKATRNRRSVWTVATQPYSGAHFATFPPDLIKPCIQAGCPEGGIVLDPFAGSGTTLQVAEQNGCKGVGIELNARYCKLIVKRIGQRSLLVA